MPISIGGINSAALRKALKPFGKLSKNSGMDVSNETFDSFVKNEAKTEKEILKLSKKQESYVIKKENVHPTSQRFQNVWKSSTDAYKQAVQDNFKFLREHYLRKPSLFDSELLSGLHATVKNLQTQSVDYLSTKMEALGSIYSPTQRLSQALAAGDFDAAKSLVKTLSSDEIKNAFSQECKKGNVTGVKALLAIKPELMNEADFIWTHFLTDGVSAGKSKMMHALFSYLPAHRQTAQAMEEAAEKINPNFSTSKKKRITETLNKLSQNFPKSGNSV